MQTTKDYVLYRVVVLKRYLKLTIGFRSININLINLYMVQFFLRYTIRLLLLDTYGSERLLTTFLTIKKLINYFSEMKTQVNVSNRIHADYLEDHVPFYAWKVINKNDFVISVSNTSICGPSRFVFLASFLCLFGIF